MGLLRRRDKCPGDEKLQKKLINSKAEGKKKGWPGEVIVLEKGTN